MSSIDDARSALEKLKRLLGSKKAVEKNEIVGVIYSLSAGKKVYIGSEYENNVYRVIKDLIVRSRSYDELGYLYDASYEVLKNDKVKLEIVGRYSVKSKKELSLIARDYIKSLGIKCVNIWDPVDILMGGKVSIISVSKGVKEYIKSIYNKKSEIESQMIDEYIKDGNSVEESKEKVKLTYKLIMCEIRKDKESMFAEKIIQ